MKIVVVGGTGLIGSQVCALLREGGHEAVPAAPSTGVDTLTGEGLAAALKGADVVVDVSNSPSFDTEPALDFFTRSARNLFAAEQEASVRHHVALSIVGVDEVPGYGYYEAKVAQENAVRGSGVPYSIVRAAQFFEFVAPVMDMSTDGTEVHGLDRLGEITLAVKPDGRKVVTDESAGLFAGMPDVLTGDESTHLASTRYEEWLKGN